MSRGMSLKAVRGALKSHKTPFALREGLIKKYGTLAEIEYKIAKGEARANSPKKNPGAAWHKDKASKARSKETAAIKSGESGKRFFYHGEAHAHEESATVAEAMHMSNPKRPPKQWFKDCVKGVKKSKKKVSDPAAVCGSLWHHKASAKAKKAAVAREKKNPVKAKIYVGVLNRGGYAQTFETNRAPSRLTHGKKYKIVVGPFQSFKAADQYAADFNSGNVHRNPKKR